MTKGAKYCEHCGRRYFFLNSLNCGLPVGSAIFCRDCGVGQYTWCPSQDKFRELWVMRGTASVKEIGEQLKFIMRNTDLAAFKMSSLTAEDAAVILEVSLHAARKELVDSLIFL